MNARGTGGDSAFESMNTYLQPSRQQQLHHLPLNPGQSNERAYHMKRTNYENQISYVPGTYQAKILLLPDTYVASVCCGTKPRPSEDTLL